MTGLATNFVEYFKREAALETLVRITFGTFMGGLVLLLTLLYSGVPIVWVVYSSGGGSGDGDTAQIGEMMISGWPERRSNRGHKTVDPTS